MASPDEPEIDRPAIKWGTVDADLEGSVVTILNFYMNIVILNLSKDLQLFLHLHCWSKIIRDF